MINRNIWAELKKDLSKPEVIVITGPRQVGKTTTVNWLMEQISSENKLSFDLTSVADQKVFEVDDYSSIVDYFESRGANIHRKLYISIDEIQYVKDLPRIVKYLYDHYRIKFILTGSSSYYLKNHFSESLAGRKFLYELLPLSFQEFLDFKGKNIRLPVVDFSSTKTYKFNKLLYNDLINEYQEYVRYGGFPEVVLEPEISQKERILDNIFSSYINKDVELLADFRSSREIRSLIELLAVRVGNRINVDELSSVSGLSRPTVNNYLTFLEQTYLIRVLPVFSGSGDVRVRSLKKLYFIDTGIASLNAELSSGAKFENTLCHQLAFYGKLSYWEKTRDGEIGFILQPSGSKKRIAIEAKETPVAANLRELARRAEGIGVKYFGLVGKNESRRYTGYLWGGSIK